MGLKGQPLYVKGEGGFLKLPFNDLMNNQNLLKVTVSPLKVFALNNYNRHLRFFVLFLQYMTFLSTKTQLIMKSHHLIIRLQRITSIRNFY